MKLSAVSPVTLKQSPFPWTLAFLALALASFGVLITISTFFLGGGFWFLSLSVGTVFFVTISGNRRVFITALYTGLQFGGLCAALVALNIVRVFSPVSPEDKYKPLIFFALSVLVPVAFAWLVSAIIRHDRRGARRLRVGGALLVLGLILTSWFNSARHKWHDTRCAAEGQRQVEEFLRADAGTVQTQLSGRNKLGAFLRLDGTGVDYPVWNIQGYHFLDLRRTAYFSAGTLPLRIIVSEGSVTAPGLKTVGKPKVERGMIFVSHPDVKP